MFTYAPTARSKKLAGSHSKLLDQNHHTSSQKQRSANPNNVASNLLQQSDLRPASHNISNPPVNRQPYNFGQIPLFFNSSNEVQVNTPEISVDDVGYKLSKETRSFFEPRMQHDFSNVRIHTDKKAARLNQILGSRAFTYQQDIYFGEGQYSPQTHAGKHLLAHELTHVVQQQRPTQVPQGIQRKIVLTGNTAHVNRVIAIMNAGIDISRTVRIKSSKELEIVDSSQHGPPTQQQQYFTQRLESLISEAGTTTVGVVSGGVPIVGSYKLSEIDIDDIEALGMGQPGWDARAALLHELVEQRERQLGKTAVQRDFGSATSGAHGEGLAAELGMIGATLESDSGLVATTTHSDGTMDGTRTVVFRYPNGTRYRVEVTISHNNITNVSRTQLP
ncbi:MAG: DUF4157 domain-containing protein [Ardenticatenaceae bacterium]|nr:DUF4157 domain-containing protein [Ardenticatenaceae bacterium]